MAVNQAIIHHLLARIQDFNEWGLIQVRGPCLAYHHARA
jgi:hypothetical protein